MNKNFIQVADDEVLCSGDVAQVQNRLSNDWRVGGSNPTPPVNLLLCPWASTVGITGLGMCMNIWLWSGLAAMFLSVCIRVTVATNVAAIGVPKKQIPIRNEILVY